jgi:hypothetical protein
MECVLRPSSFYNPQKSFKPTLKFSTESSAEILTHIKIITFWDKIAYITNT